MWFVERIPGYIRRLQSKLLYRRHRAKIRRLADHSRDAYLELQLRRTYTKQDAKLPERAYQFIHQIARITDLAQCDVLCVGCRNGEELEEFRRAGARSVVGIDLFSNRPDILVMDMHQMTFDAQMFDLIYSSHSLEHALEPARVVGEFLRVARPNAWIAIEVPVNFVPRGADLHDYQTADQVLRFFHPYIRQVCAASYLLAGRNSEGSDTVRVVFQITKEL